MRFVRLTRSTALLLSVALPLLSGACGGGGADQVSVVTLVSEQIAEGSVWSDGTVVTAGTPPFTPFSGDIDGYHPGVYARQFMSFPLGRLPPEVRIESAILRVDLREVLGSPFLSHGPLLLEHLDYGDSLDAGDFDLTPLADGLVLSPHAAIGARSLDVTALVLADLRAGRTRFQFRLRFATLTTDNDGENDCAYVTDAENSATGLDDVPLLEIRYFPRRDGLPGGTAAKQ